MSRHAVLVEFFGMPGAGKSTLSHRVAEIIRGTGIPVEQYTYELSHHTNRPRRVTTKILHVMKGLCINPTYATVSTRAILATKQRSAVDLIKVLFNWLFVSSAFRSEQNFSAIRFFDQGIFQALWSIGYSANRGDLAILQDLFSLMPTPTVTVIVEASLPTLEYRLIGRERYDSRLERHSIDMLDFMAKSASLFEEIKSLLKISAAQRNQIHILEVDNNRSEDFEENAVKIASDIQRIFNGKDIERKTCKKRDRIDDSI